MREVRVTRYSVFLSVPLIICRVDIFETLGARAFGALAVMNFVILRASRLGGLYFGA